MDDMAQADLERALARQEEALALLERLRASDPLPLTDGEADVPAPPPASPADPRRESGRQAMPGHARLELHDGKMWQIVPCDDIGTGGARASALPEWAAGPTPARLHTSPPSRPAALCLSDIMWRDTAQGTAGLRFEFLSTEEQELWADILRDVPPA